MRRRYRPTDLDTIQISFAGRPAAHRPLLSPRILSLRCCTFNCQSLAQFVVFLPCPPSPAPLALPLSCSEAVSLAAAPLFKLAADGCPYPPPQILLDWSFLPATVWIAVLAMLVLIPSIVQPHWSIQNNRDFSEEKQFQSNLFLVYCDSHGIYRSVSCSCHNTVIMSLSTCNWFHLIISIVNQQLINSKFIVNITSLFSAYFIVCTWWLL